ncbi:MAG: MFS transporter [Gammaproteobacteria bacterium]
MLPALRSTWALFLGIALIMLCNGLQGTLLGLRAGLEGFSTSVTGAIMTAYYLGFLAGSQLVPGLVGGVGHIRVFAALASLASSSVLIHTIFVDPWAWSLMRFITGFSYAGLYIVIESWLNERATNETRGQLLSIYMLVSVGAYASGQFLLNVGTPSGFQLFILASVLVSFALVPISLAPIQAPPFEQRERLGLGRLYRASPLGIVGAIGTGVGNGILVSMAAVYGLELDLSVAQITMLAAAIQIGALILQWPIGHLSDIFDRRLIITIVTFLAGVVALLGIPAEAMGGWVLLLALGLLGGLNLPMYALCIAHTNDHLNPSQMIAASGSLVLANGLGASVGPLLAAQFMNIAGPSGFLLSLSLVHFLIGLFALYRMTRSAAPEDQGHYVPMDPQSSSGAVALAAEEQIEIAEEEAGQQ